MTLAIVRGEECQIYESGYGARDRVSLIACTNKVFSVGIFLSLVDGDPANLPETENPSLGVGAHSTVDDYSKVLLMHLRAGL